jgi:hypothetical protein
MADEVGKPGLVWPGVCLVTAKNFYFWRIIDEVDQKSLAKSKHWRI